MAKQWELFLAEVPRGCQEIERSSQNIHLQLCQRNPGHSKLLNGSAEHKVRITLLAKHAQARGHPTAVPSQTESHTPDNVMSHGLMPVHTILAAQCHAILHWGSL